MSAARQKYAADDKWVGTASTAFCVPLLKSVAANQHSSVTGYTAGTARMAVEPPHHCGCSSLLLAAFGDVALVTCPNFVFL